jgi:diguanylate cyclase (GGDEF)-like protein
LLALAFIVVSRVQLIPGQWSAFLAYAPYAILVIGAAIAWKFNRSRTFFMSIILILSLLLVRYPQELSSSSRDIYVIVCLLLPFNIMVFSFLKERGILSSWGLLRMGWIALQVCFVYWILIPDQKELFHDIGGQISFRKLDLWIHVPQSAFILFTLAGILLIIRLFLYESSQDASFLGVLITSFCMLNRNKASEYAIFLTAAGLILIISVLQDTYRMAFFDELTGLPSRRALMQDMLKLGMRYSIAMLDIDFFKKFNDTYGHDTGDEVLKLVAALIKNVKGGGKAYRYGGEEFTILFSGKNVNDAWETLEELRETIASRGITVRRKRGAKNNNRVKTGNSSAKRRTTGTRSRSLGAADYKKVSIHVSIGVANKDETRKTPDEVLKAADTALYRAKKNGRNCVSK